MSFSIAKLFWYSLNPGTLLVLGVCFGTFFLWKGWTRAAQILLTPCALLILLLSLFDLHQMMARPLEERFPFPDSLGEDIAGIIVLGGASKGAVSQSRSTHSINDASERLSSFIELGIKFPQAQMVFTGGSGSLLGSQFKEADLARSFFDSQGFDPERIHFERESRNTWENAVLSKNMLGEKALGRWVLITSATHTPRSVGVFRKLGWDVIPYPVDYRTTPGKHEIFTSLSKGLPLFTSAIKEWLGLAYYRMLGHSDELFPAPLK